MIACQFVFSDGHLRYERLFKQIYLSDGLIILHQNGHHRMNKNQHWLLKAALLAVNKIANHLNIIKSIIHNSNYPLIFVHFPNTLAQ